jgi:hypothetical protein
MILRRTRTAAALVLAVSTAALVAAPAIAPAATGSGASFGPDVVTRTLHMSLLDSTPGVSPTTMNVHWAGVDRYRSVSVTKDVQSLTFTDDILGSVAVYGSGLPRRLTDVSRHTGLDSIAPDGYDQLTADWLGWGQPLLVRERSGQHVLVSVRSGGRTVLRGRIRLASNECAGERAGVRTVDFDPRTLVPLRVRETRHGMVTRDVAATLGIRAAGAFRPLHVVNTVNRVRDGFVRSTPARAAAALPFPVSMPTALPDGYALDHSGYAARGNAIGPEASFPRSRGLFAARFSRGIEPLELTIRGATGTLAKDWDENDPFGGECAAETTSTAMVGATPAQFAYGEFGSARLWWRAGTTLYTLSGALSKAQLVAVANSLAPVGA